MEPLCSAVRGAYQWKTAKEKGTEEMNGIKVNLISDLQWRVTYSAGLGHLVQPKLKLFSCKDICTCVAGCSDFSKRGVVHFLLSCKV